MFSKRTYTVMALVAALLGNSAFAQESNVATELVVSKASLANSNRPVVMPLPALESISEDRAALLEQFKQEMKASLQQTSLHRPVHVMLMQPLPTLVINTNPALEASL